MKDNSQDSNLQTFLHKYTHACSNSICNVNTSSAQHGVKIPKQLPMSDILCQTRILTVMGVIVVVIIINIIMTKSVLPKSIDHVPYTG